MYYNNITISTSRKPLIAQHLYLLEIKDQTSKMKFHKIQKVKQTNTQMMGGDYTLFKQSRHLFPWTVFQTNVNISNKIHKNKTVLKRNKNQIKTKQKQKQKQN